ncbi:hypothetical protein TWF102_007886 [Orbilia oligospora]|uniref:Uncharacterized protein n=1 Tax=Orbilia oligospora TaxID=2813651 RepID=A0A7C8JCA1_ORBOL|nr:hypothetical protein TWF102_007886 [Orbilia oligospora]
MAASCVCIQVNIGAGGMQKNNNTPGLSLLIEEENQGLVLCNRVGLKNLLHSIYTSPPPSAEAIKPNCRLFHQRSLASSAASFSAAVLRYLTISIEVSRMSSWIARVIIPIRTGPLLRT